MRFQLPRPRSPRRGVTLVEMMVSVALLVLMMTILVTIFSAATGAVSGLQTVQQLDTDLRQLDMTIRKDLDGITARMTPPLDPSKNLGYFEYGENAFADLQGEDTDDYIRFTAKAPEGQLFMGRIWTSPSTTASTSAPQPIMMTSQYAEIIYFLRNGNLYRRVLLVAPERQAAVNAVMAATGAVSAAYAPPMFGGVGVSWQGVNDLSAHPAPAGVPGAFPVILNTLGDLTNRENRAFSPRFANDFVTLSAGTVTTTPDGSPDDINPDASSTPLGDGVPDFWPTLYSQIPTFASGSKFPLVFEATAAPRLASSETMAFPYVYPGAYSQPDTYGNATSGGGWIHSLDPNPNPPFGSSYLNQLQRLNHSPLDTGDSLAPPAATSLQTWWGFPTWRETLSTGWLDPRVRVAIGKPSASPPTPGQPDGLHPFAANLLPLSGANATIAAMNLLPPMTATYRVTPQPNTDAVPISTIAPTAALWQAGWDDDLILTGVRSFDVKAYDDVYAGYADLGWGDDLRIYPAAARPAAPPFLAGTPTLTSWVTGTYDTLAQSMAHEGRMPPLTADLRLDANYPNARSFYPAPPYPSFSTYTGNIGDDGTSLVRLRRVWDTWSTDYTQAPATGFDPTTKLPVGPPWSPPIYPSYPPPYPAPLRGIQIQIRVTDPRSERLKVLTIRQDFSDKL